MSFRVIPAIIITISINLSLIFINSQVVLSSYAPIQAFNGW